MRPATRSLDAFRLDRGPMSADSQRTSHTAGGGAGGAADSPRTHGGQRQSRRRGRRGERDGDADRRPPQAQEPAGGEARLSLAPTAEVLRRLYVDQHLSLAEVGERLGCSPSWVSKLLARHGIASRRGGGRRLRDGTIDVELVRRRYEVDGRTIAEIAHELATTPDKVATRLRHAGVALRPARPRAGRLPRLPRAKLVAAYVKQRLTVDQIARARGCSPTHVRNELRRHGIRRKRTPGPLPAGWTPLTPAVLRRLYLDEALTVAEVASRVGGSAARVLAALRRAGIPRRPRGTPSGHRIEPLTAELLHQLYVVEGLSAAGVVARLGGVQDRVYPALAKYGIPSRPRHRPAPQLTISRTELEEAYVTGRRSKEEIASAYGVAVWQVTLRLRADGIRRPRQPRPKPEAPPAADLARLYLDEGLTLADLTRRYRTGRPTVRSWLDEAGIPVSPRTSRQHRRQLPLDEVEEAYWDQGCTASEIASRLGTTIDQVLRCLHDHGVPVRAGFGRDDAVSVLDQLYADPAVARVLRREGIPSRPQGGSIAERFPLPFPLTPALLRALYRRLGLSARHIELLTGQPEEQVLEALRRAGVGVRPAGSFSPWRQRQLDESASGRVQSEG